MHQIPSANWRTKQIRNSQNQILKKICPKNRVIIMPWFEFWEIFRFAKD
jgi:hypothetical protein